MKSQSKILILILLALTPVAIFAMRSRGSSGVKPEIYSNISLQEAQAKSSTSGELLIVKATASWCGPCRVMDKTTMQDPKVVQWIKENGMIVSLDIDEETSQARALRISSIPTMMAFKGTEEVSRIVGGQSADEFLAWLKEVKAGTAPGLTPLQVK